MSQLFNELKRRNVFRVGLAYLVNVRVIAQVADLVLDSTAATPFREFPAHSQPIGGDAFMGVNPTGNR